MTRPPSIWSPSPNFTPKAPAREIRCVIIHSTATQTIDSPLAWLCNLNSKVSAHYLIDTNGDIFHLVHEQNIAWHAGLSEWSGMEGVNDFSVGIELVNANDGKQEYPKEQIESCANLCADICKDNDIRLNDVVGHADIAPGRKNDPLGFDWETFRVMLAERGVES